MKNIFGRVLSFIKRLFVGGEEPCQFDLELISYPVPIFYLLKVCFDISNSTAITLINEGKVELDWETLTDTTLTFTNSSELHARILTVKGIGSVYLSTNLIAAYE